MNNYVISNNLIIFLLIIIYYKALIHTIAILYYNQIYMMTFDSKSIEKNLKFYQNLFYTLSIYILFLRKYLMIIS